MQFSEFANSTTAELKMVDKGPVTGAQSKTTSECISVSGVQGDVLLENLLHSQQHLIIKVCDTVLSCNRLVQ